VGGLQHGDESYAGSPSFFRFEAAVKELFPFKHVIPTHQGRAAEKILFSVIGGPGKVIPNNTHFDTTRANVEYTGARRSTWSSPRAATRRRLHPFKGNMDVAALERFLAARKAMPCRLVLVTVTNNAGGGQPVSARQPARGGARSRSPRQAAVPRRCRFAENAWFIHEREEGQGAGRSRTSSATWRRWPTA
jgi:tryptophanase